MAASLCPTFFFLPLAGDSIYRENKYDKNNLWISNMLKLKSHPYIDNKETADQQWLLMMITIIRF